MTEHTAKEPDLYRIGIYDNSHKIIKIITTSFKEEEMLVFDDQCNLKYGNSGEEGHLDAKDYFLKSCEHYVIKVDTFSSMSFLTGAIRRLIASKIKSLQVISEQSAQSIISWGEDLEREQLKQLEVDGAFQVRKEFSIDTLLSVASKLK